jgi:hypothetical protein
MTMWLAAVYLRSWNRKALIPARSRAVVKASGRWFAATLADEGALRHDQIRLALRSLPTGPVPLTYSEEGTWSLAASRT